MENVQLPNTATADKLDAVRDLIFGPKLAEYEQEIVELKSKLDKASTQLSTELSSVRQALISSIEQTESAILKRLQDVETAAKSELERQQNAHVSKASMSQILEQLSQKISQ